MPLLMLPNNTTMGSGEFGENYEARRTDTSAVLMERLCPLRQPHLPH